ncbi:MAG: hypothetical protein ABEH88_09780 [Halobacteriales archaeon]
MLNDPTVPEDQPEADTGIGAPEVDVPEVDAPEVDIPEVDAPGVDAVESEADVGVPDGSDASAQLRASFWGVVLLFNVALLLLSVGPMFALMRGRWRLGGGLFVAGAVAFGLGVRRVRIVKKQLD